MQHIIHVSILEGGRVMSWQENIRLLWTDHLIWIRHFLISLMFKLRDLSYVTIRTMQNIVDFAAQITPFYGVDNVRYMNPF